ncbi:DUF2853 family protein [Raineyella sp.]|uniref:DUF2853 family protein n=1 Tax=bioreactor metagenome TaxID=1076179 RepID=A0A645CZ94_9ZZZZ|nr:DUF2853 family protein [Raineyella sp.]MEA5153666.1 DUF2853 family protein [Raineyella sp.]
MATDWIADVKKYAPDADDAVLQNLLSTYRLVLSHADSALVSFSDPEERRTVRESFLKKKLGLTEDDETLDAAIKEVGARMKDGTRNGRLAVYYLLAERFGKLDVFR